MRYLRPGDYKGSCIIGVGLLGFAILSGPIVAAYPAAMPFLNLSKSQISLLIPIYGFFASVLPLWLLLVPRGYLSSYLKLGTIAALALGVIVIHPTLQMPALLPFINGGGPVVPGALFPFLFITIACGAISGFHVIIATGTTPKMVKNEGDILFIGYGAMLAEGFVALMALIAACVLLPADYFAINAAPAVYATLGMTPVHLPQLAQSVGEQLAGRTGGAVSLAVGMTYIFSSIPYMENLIAYWYHFAIMFEAVFILTAVDTGTRVGRYLMQEIIEKFKKNPLGDSDRNKKLEIILTSLVFTFSWGYLLYTGDITTIWPLFGMCNQLLATCALIIGTTMLIRMGRAKYAWVTAGPGLFMLPVTLSAGYLNIVTNFLPKGLHLLAVISLIIMVLMAIIFIDAFKCWYDLLKDPKKQDYEEYIG